MTEEEWINSRYIIARVVQNDGKRLIKVQNKFEGVSKCFEDFDTPGFFGLWCSRISAEYQANNWLKKKYQEDIRTVETLQYRLEE